jgi:hypothetical protein
MHIAGLKTNTIGSRNKLRFWFTCLLLALISTGCGPTKQDAARLEEVKAIWAHLPVDSRLQEIGSSTTSGFGKAMISKRFRSDAPYDEVKRFYVEHLTAEGWSIVSERQMNGSGSNFGGYHLEFHKGDLDLGIEYSGEKANYGWQYAIAVSWSRWVKKK